MASIGEWQGIWTRYHMADGALSASPAFSAVCELRRGGADHEATLEQTNTFYEGETGTAPRVAAMPPLSAAAFAAMPDRNSVLLVPTTAAVVWSTLDFAAAAPPSGTGRGALLELIARFQSRRARIVLQYGAAEGAAGGTRWRLQGITSIRDGCGAAAPQATPSSTGAPRFWEEAPATTRGWMWEAHRVAVGPSKGESSSRGHGWAVDLPEESSTGALNGTLSAELDTAAGRVDVPEPDLLVHAPDELSFNGGGGVTLSMAWAASRDACLRVGAGFDAYGRLHRVGCEYWKHLHGTEGS